MEKSLSGYQFTARSVEAEGKRTSRAQPAVASLTLQLRNQFPRLMFSLMHSESDLIWTTLRRQGNQKSHSHIWQPAVCGTLSPKQGLALKPEESNRKNWPGKQVPPGTLKTYSGDGVGLGSMLEKNVNDVSVALLSSLVERCVPILLPTVVTIKANKERKTTTSYEVRYFALLPSVSFWDILKRNYAIKWPKEITDLQ